MSRPAAGRYVWRSSAGEELVLDIGPDGTETTHVGDVTTTDAFRWTADGKSWLTNRITQTTGDAMCAWDPGLRQYALPLRVGGSWSSTARCLEDGRIAFRLTVDGSTGERSSVPFEGRAIEVYPIRLVFNFGPPDGSAAPPSRLTRTDWLSPELGIPVRIETKAGEQATVVYELSRISSQ